MMAMGRGLSRLTITAYADRERRRRLGDMVAMYNPESLSLGYRNEYEYNHPANTRYGTTNFKRKQLNSLSLDLLLDAQLPGNGARTVDQRLEQLRAICSAVDAQTDEPHFLQLTWGQLKWDSDGYFAGRLESMSIHYSLFDRNGAPLRATASLSLVADNSLQVQKSRLGSTATRTSLSRLPPGDNLALLDDDYLGVARGNDLDNLYAGQGRQLALGRRPGRKGTR